MAITKNPLIRYKILDRCFRNPGKRYFIEHLIAECNAVLKELYPEGTGVSRRQVLEDISFMESVDGWSIDLRRLRDGRRVYYRYADSSFSILNMPLNDVELNQLQSALLILAQFNGMPQFDWMAELVSKLQSGISTAVNSRPAMSFDNNKYLKGIGFLGLLFNSIVYKIPLLIDYKDFRVETPYRLTIHPYYLKQYNNRWFLFGYNAENTKSDWNLAIDRIVEVKESNEPYIENRGIQWDEYFEDIIGVTKPSNQDVVLIELMFYGDTGNYVINKPLHGSQKAKWVSKSELKVNLGLIPNFELEQLILSYADRVKVVSPNWFANVIKSRLVASVTRYEE